MDGRDLFPGYFGVFERSGRFFVSYDAGMHVEVIRVDEISAAEAKQARASPAALTKIILALQKRLTDRGIDPYKSNV